MEKFNSEVYQEYIKSDVQCSFEDYLFEEYNLMKFYFRQSDAWADDLGYLIHKIYQSGLLKGTEFEAEISSTYKALDI